MTDTDLRLMREASSLLRELGDVLPRGARPMTGTKQWRTIARELAKRIEYALRDSDNQEEARKQ
jgi:hypothetical protein